MMGRPRVMLTPERSFHLPVAGSISKPKQLDRDVPLVVVHRHHGVVLPGAQLHEHRIARDRARATSRPSALTFSITGADDVDVLAPEQAALAGVGVERGDGDASARAEPQPSQSAVVA